MNYSIVRNLYRLPRILERMHRMADRPDLYSEQECYEYVQYVVGLIQQTGFIKTECFGEEKLPKIGGYVMYQPSGQIRLLRYCRRTQDPHDSRHGPRDVLLPAG